MKELLPRLFPEQKPTLPRKAGGSGFTLLELMVALTIGAIAISSVYTIGAVSARQFGEQQRISNVQTALRMAMDQIKLDIGRAGYLSTPYSRLPGETCWEGGSPLVRPRAFMFLDNPDHLLVDPNNLNDQNDSHHDVQGDRLVMVGDFETRDEYLINGIDPAGNRIYLQNTWHAFIRDFTWWWGAGDGLPDVPTIQAAFAAGRWIRIINEQGMKFFVTITGSGRTVCPGADCTAWIDFTPALPVGSACLGGFALGARVAPLSMIRYRLVDIASDASVPAADRNLQSTRSATVAGANIQLAREELNPSNPPTTDPLDPQNSALLSVGGSRRALLDYAVDFDVDFMIDCRATGSSSPCLAYIDDGANPGTAPNTSTPPTGQGCDITNHGWDAAHPENNSARIRSAIVTLSARTPEQDPQFVWRVRTANEPLTRYRFSPDNRQGAARVRTLRAEILVPNLAVGGY